MVKLSHKIDDIKDYLTWSNFLDISYEITLPLILINNAAASSFLVGMKDPYNEKMIIGPIIIGLIAGGTIFYDKFVNPRREVFENVLGALGLGVLFAIGCREIFKVGQEFTITHAGTFSYELTQLYHSIETYIQNIESLF